LWYRPNSPGSGTGEKKSQNVDFFFEHTDAGGEQSIMGTPTSSIKHGDESKKGREHDFSIEM
jgi:hypothetical protein